MTDAVEHCLGQSPGMRRQVKLTEGWVLQQLGDVEQFSVPSVPTDVYQVLLAHGKIADPVQDLNELSVRWVADQDWKYTTKIRVDPQTSRSQTNVDIVFEGLDTFATVRLDGRVILESENMFLSHRRNINEFLNKDESHDHELEIIFKSARLRGQELIEEHKHEHRFIARQTEDNRIPVRKAQYHWGWDWGPVLSGTCGPWRPVVLEYYNARIDDLWAESTVEIDKCFVRLHCKTAAVAGGDKLRLAISHDGEEISSETLEIKDNGLATADFNIVSPKLWYPFSHGSQPRYKISAQLFRHEVVLDAVDKHIGLRKVELIQDVDSFGKSFYFRVNGIDVFAGGSCWIPASNHLSALSKQDYYDWVQLLRDGNQNMVRVWGGGIYEHEALYDACDEMGVLVWQDFCFACGNYPAYPSFRSSFEAEARQNVQRLRCHPALVIWAGSNEDYQVQERYELEYNYEDKDPESWLKTDFPARYYYEHLLPEIIQTEHKDAVYHPTSPWGDGKRTDNATVGDIHQWNIWHGTMQKYQYSERLSGRFVSEFGMVAYPHVETLKSAITRQDELFPGSMSMDFHNKAIGHERRLMSYVAENFRVRYDLTTFIHLSQIVQAESMAYAYKTWRKQWGSRQERQCGGVLVWQLNDCWPTISWAIVDHYRVKKPAYYAIKKALQPLAINVSRTCHDWSQTHVNDMLDLGQVDPTLDAKEGTDCEVWIASDCQEPVEVYVQVRFISIKTGEDVLPPFSKRLVAEPNSTTIVLNTIIDPLNSKLQDSTQPFDFDKYDPYVIHATMKTQSQSDILSRDTAWPQPYKYLNLEDRDIQLSSLDSPDVSSDEFNTLLKTKRPVKGLVFEEIRGMQISDNNFDIMPGESIIVNTKGIRKEDLKYTYIGAPLRAAHLSTSSGRDQPA